MSKSIIKKTNQNPVVLPKESIKSGLPTPRFEQSLEVKNGERAVTPLEPEFRDLLKAPEAPPFNFKQHFIAVAALLIFAFVLVALYSFSGKNPAGEGRGVAGNLNDLSNGRFNKQAADYTEEKICTDHSDGTKTCTTKTKLRREFR